jgi:hypothetical protein
MPHKDKDMRTAYQKEYGKNWYEKRKESVMQRNKRRRRKIADWFREYKSTLCCKDCGISHQAVLQFHHRDRTDKSFTIADVVRRASSIKQIMNEIKKSDVLCVNCHAKLHWRETHETDSWLELLPKE